jgi:oligoribonuclease NrnB/cAMP/cGMP phosphodiesterase (DHH superfamily)
MDIRKEKKMKCFYHADADGKCAGFWVALNVGINDNYVPEMHEINYNIPFPMNLILPNEQVYIVDFSISPEEMTRLLAITKDVTWIDHHKTAIEKYKDFPHSSESKNRWCGRLYAYLLLYPSYDIARRGRNKAF